MITTLSWVVFLLYAVATFSYWKDFIKSSAATKRLSSIFFKTACVVHFAVLLFFIFKFSRLPIANVSEALSTFVFITALFYLILEFWLEEKSPGTLILSVLLVMLFIANIYIDFSQAINPILYDVKFEVHVFAMLLGYSGFTLSFIASVLFLLLSRELQKKELAVFYRRLPSLAFFEKISNPAVTVGLLCITAGFVLGFYFAIQVWSPEFYMDPKIIIVFITLLVYLFHFVGRKYGWLHGQRAARISVFGFMIILFSFLIFSTVIPGAHQFG